MKFEKVLERATRQDLLEPDWEAILTAVDAVRSGEASEVTALYAIRKRCNNDNPHVAHHALLVLEAVVKNCGDKVHREIAKKEFLEDLRNIAATSKDIVREKVLELIQCWAHAFREKPEYKIVADTLQLMKLEGYNFPTLRESDAMFAAESAPEWVDSSACHRCKIQFGLLTRKHHCRNCGQIFCDRCSSQTSIIPNLGIEREVRVCETCFDKLKGHIKDSTSGSASQPESKDSKAGSDADAEKRKKEEELRLQEEEELQLALAISQSEEEEKKKKKRLLGSYYSGIQPATTPVNNSTTNAVYNQTAKQNNDLYRGAIERNGPVSEPSDENMAGVEGELAKYLNRQYWESRREQQVGGGGGALKKQGSGGAARASPTPSAPLAELNKEDEETSAPKKEAEVLQNGEVSELGDFVQSLRANVEIFVNRIKSDQARGRSVVSDSSVQSLFMTLTAAHSELLKHLQTLDERRGYYEGLQDKLAQIRDAREAVDALREEHEQKRQQESADLQRLRQYQMAQKLEAMRQKKHEYFEHQRILAIQRMQQQEQEIQMRKQQFQQQFVHHQGIPYVVSQNAYHGYPVAAAGQPSQQPAYPGHPQMEAQPGYPGQVGPQHQTPQPVQGYPLSHHGQQDGVPFVGYHQNPQQVHPMYQYSTAFAQDGSGTPQPTFIHGQPPGDQYNAYQQVPTAAHPQHYYHQHQQQQAYSHPQQQHLIPVASQQQAYVAQNGVYAQQQQQSQVPQNPGVIQQQGVAPIPQQGVMQTPHHHGAQVQPQQQPQEATPPPPQQPAVPEAQLISFD